MFAPARLALAAVLGASLLAVPTSAAGAREYFLRSLRIGEPVLDDGDDEA